MVIPPVEKQRRCLHMPLASRAWAGRRGTGCIAYQGPGSIFLLVPAAVGALVFAAAFTVFGVGHLASVQVPRVGEGGSQRRAAGSCKGPIRLDPRRREAGAAL